jgi:hypothetical protein
MLHDLIGTCPSSNGGIDVMMMISWDFGVGFVGVDATILASLVFKINFKLRQYVEIVLWQRNLFIECVIDLRY